MSAREGLKLVGIGMLVGVAAKFAVVLVWSVL